MTFLLFLASVAVLEYLLRDVRQNSGVIQKPHVINNIVSCEPSVSEETSTADLLSLGRVLDAQKTSTAPIAEHAPQATVLD